MTARAQKQQENTAVRLWLDGYHDGFEQLEQQWYDYRSMAGMFNAVYVHGYKIGKGAGKAVRRASRRELR